MPSVTTPPTPDPELVHGSLFTLRRKCGKPTCRCAGGVPHESPALSFSVDGKTKIITLRPGELEPVQDAVAAYRAARDELDEQAAGYEQVRDWLTARRRELPGR